MADASKYVGLTKKQAQNKAESDNLIFRLVSQDGVIFLGYPEDKRDDRICVEVTGLSVSKATIQ